MSFILLLETFFFKCSFLALLTLSNCPTFHNGRDSACRQHVSQWALQSRGTPRVDTAEDSGWGVAGYETENETGPERERP